MVEREQSPFPNQLKPDRSNSWAIVFRAPRVTLLLNTLCTTRLMRNQDLVDVKFYSMNMLQSKSIQKIPPFSRNLYLCTGPQSLEAHGGQLLAPLAGNPNERLSRAEKDNI